MSSAREGVSLGDLAWITLKQICSQEWVRDICLQVQGIVYSYTVQYTKGYCVQLGILSPVLHGSVFLLPCKK